MNVIIDNFDFWNMEAQKYWSFPSSYDATRRKTEAKGLATSGQYIGSVKHDGAWEMLIKDMDGNFHARSRTAGVNGSFVDKAEWIPHICKELNSIPNGTALIGEIYFPNNEGSRKITSVLNCLKDKCLERQKTNGYLHFYVFDVIAYNGKSLINEKIDIRVNHYLYYELLDALKDNNYVELAEYKEGQELWDLYGEVIANGGEGIVITDKKAPYRCGKRKARETLKMKKELSDTIDAFLDGAYRAPTLEYSGKEIETWPYWYNEKTGEKYNKSMYEDYQNGASITPVTRSFFYGWASAVSFSVMKDGKPIRIAWISGIDDILKAEIISNPEKWKGKVAALTAMEIENVTGEYTLRHGKIDHWRSDKNPEDCGWEQIVR